VSIASFDHLLREGRSRGTSSGWCEGSSPGVGTDAEKRGRRGGEKGGPAMRREPFPSVCAHKEAERGDTPERKN
jgi:hypothetical protein